MELVWGIIFRSGLVKGVSYLLSPARAVPIILHAVLFGFRDRFRAKPVGMGRDEARQDQTRLGETLVLSVFFLFERPFFLRR